MVVFSHIKLAAAFAKSDNRNSYALPTPPESLLFLDEDILNVEDCPLKCEDQGPTCKLSSCPLLERYRAAAESHPLPTKCLTCAVVYFVADMLRQFVLFKKGMGTMYDPMQSLKMCSYAACLSAPIMHFGLPLIDNLLPLEGSSAEQALRIVARSVLDQLTLAPIGIVSFLIFTSLWETHSLHSAYEHTTQNFLKLITCNWCFWGPMHLITFGIIPNSLRVLWISAVNLVWGIFLSQIAAGTKIVA